MVEGAIVDVDGAMVEVEGAIGAIVEVCAMASGAQPKAAAKVSAGSRRRANLIAVMSGISCGSRRLEWRITRFFRVIHHRRRLASVMGRPVGQFSHSGKIIASGLTPD